MNSIPADSTDSPTNALSVEIGAPQPEWQIASGSSMAHVLDGAEPTKQRGTRGWRSGPRAACGRYPQRNLEPPWFSLPIGPEADGALHRYMAQQCADCLDALSSLPGQATD